MFFYLCHSRFGLVESCNGSTVKASNFGPPQNFGPFLARSVAFLGALCTRNEHNRVFKSKVFLQLSFSSVFCRSRFDYIKSYWKRSFVCMRYKVRDFDGTFLSVIRCTLLLHSISSCLRN
jgi:hypothetical protein